MASKSRILSCTLAFGLAAGCLLWQLSACEAAHSSYSTPSREVGRLLRGFNPAIHKRFAHEYGFGRYYQGDILLRPNQRLAPKGRLVIDEQFVIEKWTDGIVPYAIVGDFTQPQLDMLEQGIAQIAEQTCVRFVPRNESDLYYVSFTSAPEGCFSYVGRSPDNQFNRINLQTPECFQQLGTPVHEMLHAIGFLHEMSREDRDDYITINVDNLQEKYQTPEFVAANFAKVPPGLATTFGVDYNYGSVMHYSQFAGAKGLCCPVIANVQPYFGEFGSPDGLTVPDAAQINAKYCR